MEVDGVAGGVGVEVEGVGMADGIGGDEVACGGIVIGWWYGGGWFLR